MKKVSKYKFPFQAGQIVNMKKSKNKTSTKQSVLAFVNGTTTPKKGDSIQAFRLYFSYCKYVRLSPLANRVISAKRFFRILDDNGYHSRPDIRGDFYENLSFNEGA